MTLQNNETSVQHNKAFRSCSLPFQNSVILKNLLNLYHIMIFIRGAHTFIDDLILLCHFSDIRIRRCTKVTGGLEKQHKLDL